MYKATEILMVSVIIPNRNGEDLITKCLSSVRMQKGVQYEIIVIDNNSSDNSLNVLRNEKDIRLIENRIDMGYSGSCCVGAKEANNPIIFFMNNDAFLTKDDQLFQICKLFENDPSIGVVGFYQINADGTPQFSGSNVDLFLSLNPDNMDSDYIAKKTKNNNIEYVFMTGGACFAVKRDTYNSLKGIDPDYYLYVEELDFMWRVQLHGYNVITYLKDPIIHLGGKSTKNAYNNTTNAQKIFFRERNTKITMIKNYGFISLCIITPFYVFMQLFEFLFLMLMFKFKAALAYIDSFLYILNNWKSISAKRHFVQKQRRVSDLSFIKSRRIVVNYFKIKHILKHGIPSIR